jgi:hypothetical protein
MKDDEFEAFQKDLGAPKPLPLLHRLLYTLQFDVLPKAAFQNHHALIRELQEPVDKMMNDIDAFGDLKIETYRQNGHSLYLITMPEPTPPCAYFVAVVFRDDEPRSFGLASPSTRYFTLENGVGGKVFLCECKRDLSHRNLCLLPRDRQAFVEAIFQRLFGHKAKLAVF